MITNYYSHAMGTNYYLKKKKKKRNIKEEISKIIDNEDISSLKEYVEELYQKTNIHIGKKSYGWKFLFNANDCKYYNLTKESIINFIKENDSIIMDEYGREISIDDFFLMVKNGENGYDLESYYLEHKEEHPLIYFGENLNNDFHGFQTNKYGEFYNDGLLFTTCSEFS